MSTPIITPYLTAVEVEMEAVISNYVPNSPIFNDAQIARKTWLDLLMSIINSTAGDDFRIPYVVTEYHAESVTSISYGNTLKLLPLSIYIIASNVVAESIITTVLTTPGSPTVYTVTTGTGAQFWPGQPVLVGGVHYANVVTVAGDLLTFDTNDPTATDSVVGIRADQTVRFIAERIRGAIQAHADYSVTSTFRLGEDTPRITQGQGCEANVLLARGKYALVAAQIDCQLIVGGASSA